MARLTEMLPAHAVADRLLDALNQVRFCVDASPHPVASHLLHDCLESLETAHRLLLQRAAEQAAKI